MALMKRQVQFRLNYTIYTDKSGKICHSSLENLELLNEAIRRRKFINHQRRETERKIERDIRKNIRRNQKHRQQLEMI
jgi:DNA-binding protein H-NS